MNLDKALKRDRKRSKRQKMIINGKSIFIIQQAIIKRANNAEGKDSAIGKPKRKKKGIAASDLILSIIIFVIFFVKILG